MRACVCVCVCVCVCACVCVCVCMCVCERERESILVLECLHGHLTGCFGCFQSVISNFSHDVLTVCAAVTTDDITMLLKREGREEPSQYETVQRDSGPSCPAE